MSTENVAVLFTDMVGSTELASGVSPEEADEIRRGHFSILRQAIAGAGGVEVKNLGDGLMVAFASASAALSCVVAMQQGVERDNRDRDHSVGLRVGLSGGEVSRDDDDYFGDPVVEAARLCGRCESGQVLAADIVRLIAGRRSRHECRSLGELTLKGLPEPVETVEVLWAPLGTTETGTAIPIPGRLAVLPWVGVVGREPEMATILDAFKRVAGGGGREVLLVSGEAGLGKTTLVAEASRAAFERGACVLFGHCEEYLATPYQLFTEPLGHYVTHAPEDQLSTRVAAHGSELARLVPELASRVPGLPPSKVTDPDTERYLLLTAVVGLLAAVSQHQPVVLVLDDLQWADKASLLLLRHFAAADLPMRVLILGTYRDSELSQAHPLLDTLAALRRTSGISRIELTGLDDRGVVAFLEAAAGYTLDEAGVGLAHAVYRETDGNPFFVSEVLRHLSETGAISQDGAGRWVADGALEHTALPDSVREVIGARVGRLGPDAARVLSIAAVIGRDFDLDVLAKATKMTDEDLLDILDAATAASLVRELAGSSGRHNFAHTLIQHTLYEDLGPTRRARAHHVVAVALEETCGDRPGARVGELAHHWSSATQPTDMTKAISYSRQAGDAALAALAPADALRYYSQALDMYPHATNPEPVLRIDLAIGLGIAQRQVGDPAHRETLLEAAALADRFGEGHLLVAAALANNRGFESAVGEVDRERIAVLEQALEASEPESTDRARLLATLGSELSFAGEPDRLRALFDEALGIARSSDDPATLVWVLNMRDGALRLPETLAARRETSAEALHLAEALADPIAIFRSARRVLDTALETGDRALRDRAIEIQHEVALRVGQPLLIWIDTRSRAQQVLLDGDPDEAERLAEEALALGTEIGQPDALTVYGGQLLPIRLHQGRVDEILEIVAEFVAANPGIPAFAAALASGYVECGREAEAEVLLRAVADDAFAGYPRDELWLIGMAKWGHVAARLGDPDTAAMTYEQLAPWSGQIPSMVVGMVEPVDNFLGRLAAALGRFEDAEAHFAASEAQSRSFGCPYFVASTQYERAVAHIAAGAPELAAPLLDEAEAIASAHGYRWHEQHSAEALAGLAYNQ